MLLSTLSENDARITGLLLTPRMVCVDVIPTPLIVLETISKLEEAGLERTMKTLYTGTGARILDGI